MRIGAYQFRVTSNIEKNFEIIKKAILRAAKERVRLLVFPECALTGYPLSFGMFLLALLTFIYMICH